VIAAGFLDASVRYVLWTVPIALQYIASFLTRHADETARSAFDLQLRYRPPREIDLARLDLWAAQLLVDHAAHDAGAVGADAFALDYVRDRLLYALRPTDLRRLNEALGAIQVAIADQTLGAAASGAQRLRDLVAQIQATT
jgi:hypothetical protein